MINVNETKSAYERNSENHESDVESVWENSSVNENDEDQGEYNPYDAKDDTDWILRGIQESKQKPGQLRPKEMLVEKPESVKISKDVQGPIRNKELSSTLNKFMVSSKSLGKPEGHSKSTQEVQHRLYRTQFCRSIDQGSDCLHGEMCNYAHSLEELRVVDCTYGEKCHRICYSPDGVLNVNNRVCIHKHPGEDKDSFLERTGFDKYKDISQSVSQRAMELGRFSNDKQETHKITPKGKQGKNKDKYIPKCLSRGREREQLRPNLNDEVVLKVQAELAAQAVELAVRGGRTNIRLEIIQ